MGRRAVSKGRARMQGGLRMAARASRASRAIGGVDLARMGA